MNAPQPDNPVAAAPDPGGGQPDTAKRRQILEGARQVFRARGFEGASMGEIAKSAGVSKGTLYVYFDSKEALFEALIMEERQGLAERLFRLDLDDPDMARVLRGLGLSYLEEMARPEHIASLRMVLGATEQFPRIGQLFFEAGPSQGVQRLKAYLEAQVAAGRLAIDDTRLAAQHFLDLCQSWLLKRLLFGVADRLDPAECRYHVDAALRVFLAAYGR